VDSIIDYFILFSMMGMNTLGIREIAINKTDRDKLSDTFNNLITLNGITTLAALISLIAVTLYVPELRENSQLMAIGGIKLASNFLLIEWFYRGLEEFKYITIRSIIVRSLYAASVFLLIREPEDYTIYYLLTVLTIAANACINFIYSGKFIMFSFKNINLRPILKPFFILGVYSLLTSMYTTFNIAFLGFTSNDTQVGYYTTATKIYAILLALFTSFTGVLLPRMSALISEGETEECKTLIKKSCNILFSFAIPAVIFFVMLAPEIVSLISGTGYEGAIVPMRIVMPLMLIIGYEQILVIQTLMPMKKDRIIMRNSVIGATLGLGLNMLLVPQLQATGSAIVWVCCEFVILALSQIAVTQSIAYKFPLKMLFREILTYAPGALGLFYISQLPVEFYWKLAFSGIIGSIYFVFVNLYLSKYHLVGQMILAFMKSKCKRSV